MKKTKTERRTTLTTTLTIPSSTFMELVHTGRYPTREKALKAVTMNVEKKASGECRKQVRLAFARMYDGLDEEMLFALMDSLCGEHEGRYNRIGAEYAHLLSHLRFLSPEERKAILKLANNAVAKGAKSTVTELKGRLRRYMSKKLLDAKEEAPTLAAPAEPPPPQKTEETSEVQAITWQIWPFFNDTHFRTTTADGEVWFDVVSVMGALGFKLKCTSFFLRNLREELGHRFRYFGNQTTEDFKDVLTVNSLGLISAVNDCGSYLRPAFQKYLRAAFFQQQPSKPEEAESNTKQEGTFVFTVDGREHTVDLNGLVEVVAEVIIRVLSNPRVTSCLRTPTTPTRTPELHVPQPTPVQPPLSPNLAMEEVLVTTQVKRESTNHHTVAEALKLCGIYLGQSAFNSVVCHYPFIKEKVLGNHPEKLVRTGEPVKRRATSYGTTEKLNCVELPYDFIFLLAAVGAAMHSKSVNVSTDFKSNIHVVPALLKGQYRRWQDSTDADHSSRAVYEYMQNKLAKIDGRTVRGRGINGWTVHATVTTLLGIKEKKEM